MFLHFNPTYLPKKIMLKILVVFLYKEILIPTN